MEKLNIGKKLRVFREDSRGYAISPEGIIIQEDEFGFMIQLEDGEKILISKSLDIFKIS